MEEKDKELKKSFDLALVMSVKMQTALVEVLKQLGDENQQLKHPLTVGDIADVLGSASAGVLYAMIHTSLPDAKTTNEELGKMKDLREAVIKGFDDQVKALESGKTLEFDAPGNTPGQTLH